MELRTYQTPDGLLCGGDEKAQDEDIKTAKRHFEDFKQRTAAAEGGKRT